eukprot:363426-Chlamydomonas_euryale.AAC.5
MQMPEKYGNVWNFPGSRPPRPQWKQPNRHGWGKCMHGQLPPASPTPNFTLTDLTVNSADNGNIYSTSQHVTARYSTSQHVTARNIRNNGWENTLCPVVCSTPCHRATAATATATTTTDTASCLLHTLLHTSASHRRSSVTVAATLASPDATTSTSSAIK